MAGSDPRQAPAQGAAAAPAIDEGPEEPPTADEPSYHAAVVRRPDDVRWRWLGLGAVVSLLLPLSPASEGGLYFWELLAVASSADALRLLAPALLALVLVGVSVAPRLTRLGQSLAVLVALLLVTPLYASAPLAFEQSFRGLFDFVGRRPLVLSVGLALLAAGGDLFGSPGELAVSSTTRRIGRVLLGVGSALLLLGCLLPYRTEPEIWRLVRHAAAAAEQGGARLLAGQALLLLLGSLPLWLAAAGLSALRGPVRSLVLLGFAARYGVSLLGALLGLRLLVGEPNASVLLVQLRAALLLAVGVGAAASAIVSLTRHLLDAPLPPTGTASLLIRDIRLRALLRAAQAASARSEPRARDLLRAPDEARSHPWLAWLMRRRLAELAAECDPRPDEPTRPDDASAERMLDALEPRPARRRATARLPRQRAALWLTTGARRLTLVVGIAIVAYGAVLGALVRPARVDLGWSLLPPPDGAEALFASALPRYVVALSRRDDDALPGSEAPSGRERLAALEQEVLGQSAQLDAELARRFAHLFRVADRVDRTGQLWLSAVHAVNGRIRALGWPFYVDGNVLAFVSRSDGAPRRLFYVTTFRVEAIRRFAARGRPYAALHVRRLDRLNITGARLGAVRPDEPFALVLLPTIERSVEDRLFALTAAESCGFGRVAVGRALDDPLAAIEVDRRCGALLTERLDERGTALRPRDRAAPEGEPTDEAPEAPATDDPSLRERVDSSDGREAARRRAAELVVGQVIDATERHEIQHQANGDRLDVPGELYSMAAFADDAALERMAQEASASLAELTTDDALAAGWRLADLTAHLIEQPASSPYRYAAALVIGRLHGRPVLDAEGRVVGTELLRFWDELAQQGDSSGRWLAPRARRAHQELFGAPIALDGTGAK